MNNYFVQTVAQTGDAKVSGGDGEARKATRNKPAEIRESEEEVVAFISCSNKRTDIQL